MTKNPVILVNPPFILPNQVKRLNELEARGYHLWYNGTGLMLSQEELRLRVGEAVASIAGLERYDAAMIAAAPKLRAIARFGVGFDNVDLVAAKQAGIEVTITPDTNSESVADMVMALTTNLCCAIMPNHHAVMKSSWKKIRFPGLFGLTLGIIGFGRIGQAVAKRAAAFGMKILTYDKFHHDGESAVSFEELLTRSDVLSLHVPRQDHPILNARHIAMLKPGAFVINTARGGLIDEEALADALILGRIGGAGLDVFAEEPLGESRLRMAPNVILTPHMAGTSDTAIAAMADMSAENIELNLDDLRVPEKRVIVPRG